MLGKLNAQPLMAQYFSLVNMSTGQASEEEVIVRVARTQ